MVRDNRFSRLCGWGRAVGFSAVALFALSGVSGCFSHYRANYTMADVQAKPASLMVAQKIQRPLILVLDSERVPDVWDMKEASSMNPQNGPQFKLLDFQRFVTRDLKNAMGNYFSRVEVVKKGDPMPSEPHVVGDVKVDRLQLHTVPAGGLAYTIIEMTWGMGLRLSEASEYAFTFAGEGRSSEAYPTFEVGCAQLVESAIQGFSKGFVEKGGFEALRPTQSQDKLAESGKGTDAAAQAQAKQAADKDKEPASTAVVPASNKSTKKHK